MKTLFLILLITFFSPLFILGQKIKSIPYKGGETQFDKDIESTLLVETSDSGRVYFVEVSYLKQSREVDFFVHGIKDNDITKMLIRSFFKQNRDKWDKRKLKKMSVIIPIFITPKDVMGTHRPACTNLEIYAMLIEKSFTPKVCFFYKPVYKLIQETQIDVEPDWKVDHF